MDQEGEKDLFADGEAYENYIGRWSRPVGHMFLDWLSQSPGLRWADIGCGTGALTETILKRAEPDWVVGVEPSESFLKAARTSIEDVRAKFMPGDAQSLPLEKHEVDVAVSGLVLNFVPDKKGALNEMRRVVKPGGTVAAYVWDYSGDMQLIWNFWEAATTLFPDGVEHDEGNQFPICRPDPLAELFSGVGLEAVETCSLDIPTVFADFDDYWSPFLKGQGPAGAFCASLSRKDQERLRAKLESTLPMDADGTIGLVARAWAVRGTA